MGESSQATSTPFQYKHRLSNVKDKTISKQGDPYTSKKVFV